jgi:ABC-2 type transport system permease protein
MSRGVWVVARKDLRDIFRSRSTYLYILVMLVASSSYFFSYIGISSSLARQHASPAALRAASAAFLGIIAYLVPLLYCLYACNISSATMILDKTKRNLEVMLATPLSVTDIWLGKTLAAAIPAVILGLGVSVFSYLVIALAEVAPKIHQVIGPSPLAIVSGLVVVPVLTFVLLALMTYLQLVISNPRVSVLAFVALFILVLGVLIFAVNYFPTRGINLSYIVVIYLGLIAVVSATTRRLARSLTPEKVVLSTKG